MSRQPVLDALSAIIEERRLSDPSESYVAGLLQGDEARVLKKIGEEAVELVVSICEDDREAMVHEAADLWFHSLVALARHDLSAQDVLNELERRFGISGIEEKASRQK